ncbi:MAG: hypothetical protein QM706_15400, partial [Nitrospira sp.]
MMTSKAARVSVGGSLVFLGLFSLLPVSEMERVGAKEMKRTPCDIPSGQNVMRAEETLGRGSH